MEGVKVKRIAIITIIVLVTIIIFWVLLSLAVGVIAAIFS